MPGQTDQTTTKGEMSKDTTTPDDNKAAKTSEVSGEKKEKKMGFFAKWRKSTAEAYEKHRAAGGNL